MKPESEVKVKYGVWGLIVGAVIAMIIGFAWGGWFWRVRRRSASPNL
jgi:O-antigen/teichoic acid export membrane protein